MISLRDIKLKYKGPGRRWLPEFRSYALQRVGSLHESISLLSCLFSFWSNKTIMAENLDQFEQLYIWSQVVSITSVGNVWLPALNCRWTLNIQKGLPKCKAKIPASDYSHTFVPLTDHEIIFAGIYRDSFEGNVVLKRPQIMTKGRWMTRCRSERQLSPRQHFRFISSRRPRHRSRANLQITVPLALHVMNCLNLLFRFLIGNLKISFFKY